MKRQAAASITVTLVLVLSGCTTERVKGAVYESLHQKGCIDRSGSPHCDPGHKDYDAYQKEREKALKPNP